MKLLSLTFLLVFSITVFAQKNLDVQWGNWGLDAPEYANYTSLGKSYEDETGFLLINDDAVLEYYDKDLDKRSSTPLLSSLKDSKVILTRRLHKKTYMVVAEKNSVVKLYKYDHRTNAAVYQKDLFSIKKANDVDYVMSPDSSRYLFYLHVAGKNSQLNTFVTDSLFKVKWEKTEIAVQTKDKWFLSPAVSPSGAILYADKDKDNLKLTVISDRGKQSKTTDVKLLGTKPINTVSCATMTNAFSTALIYNKDNFSKKCVDKMQLITLNESATIVANANIEIGDCLGDRMAVHLVPIGEKNLMLIAEKFITKVNDSNNQCTYGAFNAFGIDMTANKIMWNKEIFKNLYFVSKPDVVASPHSKEYKTKFGHAFFQYKGVSYLFYGDNCQNCINTVQKAKSHSNLKNSCIAMVSIDQKGNVARHTYPSMPNVKYQVDISSIVRVENNKVLFKANGKQKRFGLITLNRL